MLKRQQVALTGGSDMIAKHAKCITPVYNQAAGGRQAGRQMKHKQEDMLSESRQACGGAKSL